MGFELNKLMRQFGVSSPTLPTYTGSTDQDRAAYDDYTQQYNNRLASVPMYNQTQFETSLSPVQAAPQSVLNAPVYSPPVTSSAPVTTPTTPTVPNYGGVGADFTLPNFNYDGMSYNIPSYSVNTTPTISQVGVVSGGQREFTPSNVDMYSHGGEVKKFAVGGLNDLADSYGITNDAGIKMLPGQDVYAYGPRPKQGPLGPWFEDVVTEIVPGVKVAGRARTPARNQEVGGVPDSYHLTDNARDFQPPKGMTNDELGQRIKRELGSGFDVIFGSKGHYDHTHVEPGPGLIRGKAAATPSTSAEPTAELGSMTPPPKGGAAPTGGAAELKTLLDAYGDESVYADELKAARAKATEEADAFKSMLESSLASPEDAKASKAEMYFRLAAAFGSPTKTGGFGENLGLASKELADYSKGQRESAREKLGLRMELQKMRMGAAKEDLATLRTLSAEEMKDERAIKQSMIKDYIESGKPQSAAGKQALDEGYKPGTPEFQTRVRQVAALNVQKETAQIEALLENLRLNQKRDEREEKKGEKLTPQELTMKRETEDALNSTNQAMEDIRTAYSLNPNTFDTSAVDTARRKALELAGADDPRLKNTRIMENLLGQQALERLRSTFGGNPTEGERAILLDLQGIGAKSVSERAAILRRAYTALQRRHSQYNTRLKDVSSGAYREVSGE